MNFKEFQDDLLERIINDHPDMRDNLRIDTVSKLGNTYTALIWRMPGSNMAPCINLDTAYRNYVAGNDIAEITARIGDVLHEHAQKQTDLEWVWNYEDAKKRFYIRVCNTEANQNILKNVPHTEIEDLSVTYHILIDEDPSGLASTIVTNTMLEKYGVTFEQLHSDAVTNSTIIMPARVETMAGICGEFFNVPEDCSMLVISNSHLINGASALFYPDVMDKISEKIGGNYIILPSSIHETIVLPDSEGTDIAHMEEMVKMINENTVSTDERLSNHVYHYDCRQKIFELGESYCNRMILQEKLEQFMSEPIQDKNKFTLS